MTLRNRLSRLEATATRVISDRCPTCDSDDGGVSTYKSAVAERQPDGTLLAKELVVKGPPGTPDRPSWYGEDLRCRECGARPRRRFILIPPAAEELAYIHGLAPDAKP